MNSEKQSKVEQLIEKTLLPLATWVAQNTYIQILSQTFISLLPMIVIGAFVSIPWWRSHPIHENRTTESIWTEPCNPLLRATKSTKRATSIYEITLIFYLIFE